MCDPFYAIKETELSNNIEKTPRIEHDAEESIGVTAAECQTGGLFSMTVGLSGAKHAAEIWLEMNEDTTFKRNSDEKHVHNCGTFALEDDKTILDGTFSASKIGGSLFCSGLANNEDPLAKAKADACSSINELVSKKLQQTTASPCLLSNIRKDKDISTVHASESTEDVISNIKSGGSIIRDGTPETMNNKKALLKIFAGAVDVDRPDENLDFFVCKEKLDTATETCTKTPKVFLVNAQGNYENQIHSSSEDRFVTTDRVSHDKMKRVSDEALISSGSPKSLGNLFDLDNETVANNCPLADEKDVEIDEMTFPYRLSHGKMKRVSDESLMSSASPMFLGNLFDLDAETIADNYPLADETDVEIDETTFNLGSATSALDLSHSRINSEHKERPDFSISEDNLITKLNETSASPHQSEDTKMDASFSDCIESFEQEGSPIHMPSSCRKTDYVEKEERDDDYYQTSSLSLQSSDVTLPQSSNTKADSSLLATDVTRTTADIVPNKHTDLDGYDNSSICRESGNDISKESPTEGIQDSRQIDCMSSAKKDNTCFFQITPMKFKCYSVNGKENAGKREPYHMDKVDKLVRSASARKPLQNVTASTRKPLQNVNCNAGH